MLLTKEIQILLMKVILKTHNKHLILTGTHHAQGQTKLKNKLRHCELKISRQKKQLQ
jgi:hypothetical protein